MSISGLSQPLSRVFSLYDAASGAWWAGGLAWEGYGLLSTVRAFCSPSLLDKVDAVREVALRGLCALSGVAGVLHWANSVKWLSLGRIVSLVGKVWYGSTLLVSGFRALAAARTAYMSSGDVRNLALIKLAANVSAITWAVFGLISLATATSILALPMTVFLFAGGVLGAAAFALEWFGYGKE